MTDNYNSHFRRTGEEVKSSQFGGSTADIRANSMAEIMQSSVTVSEVGSVDMDLPFKRLSGSQRRRLRKEEKIAAGRWTAEKPASKYANKKYLYGNVNKTGIKRHCPNFKFPQGKIPPPQNINIPQPQNITTTPPQDINVIKTENTSSDVALHNWPYNPMDDGIKMVVIDKRHPEITLTKEQADLIQKQLENILDEITVTILPLQFHETVFKEEVLWINCVNERSKSWLIGTIQSLQNLWEGANLAVVEPENLPKRSRMQVFIPNSETELDLVRARLSRQNPDLHPEGWILVSRDVENDGQVIVFSIEEKSMEALRFTAFRAFYMLGTVIFDDPKDVNGCSDDESDESVMKN